MATTTPPTDEKPTVWVSAWHDDEPERSLMPEWQGWLQDSFEVVTYEDLALCPEKGSRVQGAICEGRTFARLLEQMPLMPSLKVIANNGVGVNHIDFRRTRELGIKVANTRDVLSATTADMAMTLLLAAARDLIKGVRLAMGQSTMPRFILNTFGEEVTGSALGIVGLGGIGMKIAERARAFDMRILYHNRRQRPASEEARVAATYSPRLVDMLHECDFVVIACPLTDETRHMFGKDQFRAMKNSATLVNIARGDIIDQEALVEALRTNEIRGAALDVTTPEPLPRDHALLQLENVIISPHCGSATYKCRSRMARTVMDNLRAGLIDNVPLPDEVKVHQ